MIDCIWQAIKIDFLRFVVFLCLFITLCILAFGCTVIENEQDRHFRKAVSKALSQDHDSREEINGIVDGRLRATTNSAFVAEVSRGEVESAVQDAILNLFTDNWEWLLIALTGGWAAKLQLKNGKPKTKETA